MVTSKKVYKCAGGMTHEEIGRVMGISRARVWQIEQQALAKLSRNLRAVEIIRAAAQFAESVRSRNVLCEGEKE